jgi:predicted aspartyl protease
MLNRLSILPATILVMVFPTHLVAQPQGDTLNMKLIRGKSIIVEAKIDNNCRVNALIDTGANCSVISRRVAKRLHLRTLLKDLPFLSIERMVHRPFVVVPSVVLGPIHRPIDCLADDIPFEGVDLIVAQDVLMAIAFTVDYRRRSLQFGSGAPLNNSVRFVRCQRGIVVPLQVGSREIPVLLDSGADGLLLFADRVSSWLPTNFDRAAGLIPGISTRRRAIKVHLPDVRFGNDQIDAVDSYVIEAASNSKALEWHGLIGLSQLRAKRVRFDFPNGLFSWER